MSQVRALLRAFVATALVAAAVPVTDARAQNTGVIEGTITDEQGGVMPGAAVTLRNVETGAERTMTSEADGRYRFPALQPGTYVLTTSLQGFATQEIRNIVVTIGLDARYDVKLKLQTLAETVTVT